MKTPAFDEFAMQMKSRWDAETRLLKALEDAAELRFRSMFELHHLNTAKFIERLCATDERLKPPCP